MFIGVVSSIWCEQFVVMVVNSTNTLFRNIDIDIYIYIYNVFQIIVSYTIYVNIMHYPVNENILKQTVLRFVYLS